MAVRAEKPLPVALTQKAIVAEDGADPLRKLLVARYNVALAEVQKRFTIFGGLDVAKSGIEVDPLGQAAVRLLKAGLDLANDPAERVKVHERHVGLTRELERLAEIACRAELLKSAADLDLARYYRADAEIGLMRAQKEAAQPKKK
jgi:hypothetical protein